MLSSFQSNGVLQVEERVAIISVLKWSIEVEGHQPLKLENGYGARQRHRSNKLLYGSDP